VFLKLCNTLLKVLKYVIHPKTVLGYLKWGIASSIHLFGHEHCPSNGVAKNDLAHGVL
jgi:hypothetical protein